ncbi:molybdopterin biosynthesis protein [Desulfosarcina ovata subsp. sediminis]|uniref:Molybdopterin molybdenumtransferase n=1 Tax=Desulfosarcina ovata subsp. sediminis TaxID=885957 RepID=A0A5K8A1C1_9BACT|nr:molybdopterin-binding protein [Desulfosarcina ovata]BBO86226.1 molybdopterin biosynthesis protein [Desulfosarcina ovata subsp. sediminis]
MKAIPVEEAVGKVLCHDITQIVPGFFKGRAFKKGRIIQPDDVEKLLDLGKAHIYVFDMQNGTSHEDEAAHRIAIASAGNGLRLSDPVEGKVNLIATRNGLLTINTEALSRINAVEDIMFATLHTHRHVQPDQPVGGTRIIPLFTETKRIQAIEEICRECFPVVQVKPFAPLKVGIVTTGSEIYHGRIEDRFGPVLRKKFGELGSRVIDQIFVSDDIPMTVEAIHGLIRDGAQLVAVTGGMSVDPDDQTPASIRAAGAEIITYGAPVLPGAMFMLAHIGDVPVVGLPGCVMYYGASIFDLVIPRMLAGETISREDIVSLGHGGFCANCPDCRYPNCPFGK